MKRYCPYCREENPAEATTCLYCHQNLARSDDYVSKLIWSLNHQDRETATRAAIILGKLGVEALPALPELFRTFKANNADPYLQAAILEAIANIEKTGSVLKFLIANLEHPSIIVRLAALKVFKRKLNAIPKNSWPNILKHLQKYAQVDASVTVRSMAHEIIQEMER